MEVQMAFRKSEEQSAAGDLSFQDLFKAYYPHVVRQIVRIVHDQARAEDIAQDVFLQFYHTDRTRIENIPAWLAKVSLHAAYNEIRSEKRRLQRDEKEVNPLCTYSLSSEETWLQKEEIHTVREVLTEMDERDRVLLLMKYSGFNYRELAKAIDVENGSVGTLLARAKTKFSKLYKKMRGDYQ
ncbi:RNA polymerase sigma factor SigX [Aneurinibacillus tyrosinisolvens]|uniref:RNA polymerase sigma factor SigX n=1 Tax=Aneurinibacillus tyrosinisolvens TaxID=1443435 RepID=UPI00063FB295|nr:RNA polymerase sigma factor SigX [Aneurinibacillus tyrosinisolvens]